MSPVKRPKGAKGKADALFSRLVRSKGFCEACAVGWEPMPKSPGGLETAHIIGRKFSATRVEGIPGAPGALGLNAYCLCSSHHRRFGEWGMDWARWIEATIGVAGYDALHKKAQDNGGRVWRESDWRAEVERLTVLLAEVER